MNTQKIVGPRKKCKQLQIKEALCDDITSTLFVSMILCLNILWVKAVDVGAKMYQTVTKQRDGTGIIAQNI